MKGTLQLVLIAAIALTVVGAIVLLFRTSSPGGVEVILPAATATPKLDIRIHVKGEVRHPGVYALNDGDRLEQAIEAAGGLTSDADLMAINLARRVRDEDEWYIPKVGESTVPATVQSPSDAARPDDSLPPSAQAPPSVDKIDINSATVAQLRDELPGIGDVRALAIVSYREANGRFSSVAELLDVHGIGPKTLEQVRDLVEAR